MSRTLLLMRHAKSSWSDPGLSDHERPLNGRGRRAAENVGAYLQEQEQAPEFVLSSTARRTVETLDRMRPEWSEVEVHYERRLYLASPDTMLACLQEVPDRFQRVMLLAHNPGTHSLGLALVGDGSAGEIARLEEKFPTAACALFSCPISSWQELTEGENSLLEYLRPRDLV